MITLALLYSIATLAIGTTLFGFCIAELNAPEKSIREDLKLTDAELGLCNSIFALGGLLGAFIGSSVINFLGPRKSALTTSVLFAMGGLAKGLAQGVILLVLGRAISGIAAGMVTVIVPLFINDLAPEGAKGRLGATTQITINIGILVTQVLGAICNESKKWRFVMMVGGTLGALQAVMLVGVSESPLTLYRNGDKESARKALIAIRGTDMVDGELERLGNSDGVNEETSGSEAEPLMANSNVSAKSAGLVEFITSPDYRRQFALVATIMLVQQFTGINAVVMYGVSILGGFLPEWAGSLNASISAINLFITIGASSLFDKISHKTLLLTSIMGMATFAGVLATGIYSAQPLVSTVGIFLFVSSFSLGLGPLPWMVASANVPVPAVASAQSVALVANWGSTGIVSFFVPVVAAHYGMTTLFVGFSCVGILSFLWGLKYIPK